MRLIIAAVGRLKDDGERALIDRYVKRLGTGRSSGFGPLSIDELIESRAATADLRKSDEATRLIKAAGNAGLIVALDEHGRGMTSEAFAGYLGMRRDDGTQTAAFLIGGPDGHGPQALAAAHLKLALGPMTMPHGLARVVLVEQLYRAMTILTGHPYHRS